MRGGRRMGEFSFKNLSVKLFPEVALAEGAAHVCECCSYEWRCDDCSCTDTPTAPECGPCTDTPTEPPECGPCTNTPTDPECGPCTLGESCAESDCFPLRRRYLP
jgi:hypothetical protein